MNNTLFEQQLAMLVNHMSEYHWAVSQFERDTLHIAKKFSLPNGDFKDGIHEAMAALRMQFAEKWYTRNHQLVMDLTWMRVHHETDITKFLN